MSSVFTKYISAYRNSLKNYPIATQAVQVAFLMGAGDVIAQNLVEKVPLKSLNLRRTAEFSCIGFFLVGPGLRFWYGKLDKIVPPSDHVWHRTIKKTCLDQLAFAPVFIAVFTATLSAIQGLNKDEIVDRLKTDYLPVLKMNYTIWPAAQLINFALVPLNFQVLFAQCVAILWNTYLSVKLGEKTNENKL